MAKLQVKLDLQAEVMDRLQATVEGQAETTAKLQATVAAQAETADRSVKIVETLINKEGGTKN